MAASGILHFPDRLKAEASLVHHYMQSPQNNRLTLIIVPVLAALDIAYQTVTMTLKVLRAGVLYGAEGSAKVLSLGGFHKMTIWLKAQRTPRCQLMPHLKVMGLVTCGALAFPVIGAWSLNQAQKLEDRLWRRYIEPEGWFSKRFILKVSVALTAIGLASLAYWYTRPEECIKDMSQWRPYSWQLADTCAEKGSSHMSCRYREILDEVTKRISSAPAPSSSAKLEELTLEQLANENALKSVLGDSGVWTWNVRDLYNSVVHAPAMMAPLPSNADEKERVMVLRYLVRDLARTHSRGRDLFKFVTIPALWVRDIATGSLPGGKSLAQVIGPYRNLSNAGIAQCVADSARRSNAWWNELLGSKI